MLAYNHANYIEDAISSVLEQECVFTVELVIVEDCSSDETYDICLRYQSQYQDRIRLISNEQNLGMRDNFLQALKACKGKYIALCEGDDYWTDKMKLQKQVGILERNLDYSLVCGNYFIRNTYDGNFYPVKYKNINIKGDFEFDLSFLNKEWITKTLTVIFRRSELDLDKLSEYKYARDAQLIYLLLKSKKGYFIHDYLGVYRVHMGGVFSSLTGERAAYITFNVFREMYYKNKDRYTLISYFNALVDLLKYSLWNEKWRLFYEGFSLPLNLYKKVVLVIAVFLPRKLLCKCGK